jgi:hypothetical protein
LAIYALLAHWQIFEFACGHHGSGHLMIVIARAFKKNISTFMAVLSVYVLGASQALYVLDIDVAADRDGSPAARIIKSWLALFRVATGEKPSWGKHDQDWDEDGEALSRWKITFEQILVYAIYVLFVILVFIILLRLLISMFNETYGEVKKNRDQIFRLQRGVFILTAERRLRTIATILKCGCCCARTYHGVRVKTSIGQRLLCHMWLGETVQVVDNVPHVDENDGVPRTMTKDDLENEAIHAVAEHDLENEAILATSKSLNQDVKRKVAKKIRNKLEDELRQGDWTIQPGPHSYMQTTPTLPARWSALHKTPPSIRTGEMQNMQDAKMKAMVLGTRT